MADDFQTAAELEIRIPDAELRKARRTIEDELGSVEVGVSASVATGGQQPRDPQTGQFMEKRGIEQRLVELQDTMGRAQEEAGGREERRRRREYRWAQQRTEYAEEQVELLTSIEDKIEDLEGGGGVGLGGILGGTARGLGKGIGGGLALSALGIGAGVGIGALGLGAGIGAAREGIGEEQFVIETGNITVTPVLQGPFVQDPQFTLQPTLGPENVAISVGEEAFQFSPVFEPEMFNIDTRVAIGDDAFQFNPTLGAEMFNFNPTIGSDAIQLGPENFEAPKVEVGDVTIDPTISFSPSITFAPTLSITGVNIDGSLGEDLADAILDSRRFRKDIEKELDQLSDDIRKELTG